MPRINAGDAETNEVAVVDACWDVDRIIQCVRTSSASSSVYTLPLHHLNRISSWDNAVAAIHNIAACLIQCRISRAFRSPYLHMQTPSCAP